MCAFVIAARVARAPAAEGFDRLYARTVRGLVRQLHLVTCDVRLAQRSVEHAFRRAWQRWPEVAVDPQPEGWVRAAACEYALSPWTRLRHPSRRGGGGPLLEAMRRLTGIQRYAVVLHDALGVDLPETAAEIQASTPVTAARLTRAHAALAGSVPELADLDPLTREFSKRLGELLADAAGQVRATLAHPARVRGRGEAESRRLVTGTFAMVVVLVTAMLTSLVAGR